MRGLYQAQETIMSHVFRRLSRAQQAKGKSKNGVAVTFVQDLKSFSVAVRRFCQQPFVCHLVRQSKRSILQEASFLLFNYY